MSNPSINEWLVQRKRARAAFFFALLWFLVTVSVLVWGVSAYDWDFQVYAFGAPMSILGVIATMVIGFRPKSRVVRALLFFAALCLTGFVAYAVIQWA